MRIAMQEGMGNLRDQLISDGFSIIEGSERHADCYLYYENKHYENNLNTDTVLNPVQVFQAFRPTYFDKSINVRGKTYDMIKVEILCMILESKKDRFSGLF